MDAALIVPFPELAPELAEIREELGIAETWCGDFNKYVSWAEGDSGDKMVKKGRRGIFGG